MLAARSLTINRRQRRQDSLKQPLKLRERLFEKVDCINFGQGRLALAHAIFHAVIRKVGAVLVAREMLFLGCCHPPIDYQGNGAVVITKKNRSLITS